MTATPPPEPTPAATGTGHGPTRAAMPDAIDLDRIEAILERQVEEVAYTSTLRTLNVVLPDTLRAFLG